MSAPINTLGLEDVAWKAFRALEVEYVEVFWDDIYEKVGEFVVQQGYGRSALCSLGQSLTACYRRVEFDEQVRVAQSPTEMNYRLAVFAIVNQLREMVGVKERFGSLDEFGFIFLGRYRRDVNELPLTPERLAKPKERDRVVDLWGSTRTRVVMVRWSECDALRVDRFAPGDSHVGEARRRLMLHQANRLSA
jgi:hypothetical protein